MGKLHGLTIGLDVCSTLHMDVSLDDLGWCIDQIMPANPGYLMALPTRIDPMLGYLTTGYQDHVHIREKFGFKVNDCMWQFFQQLAIWMQLNDAFVATLPNVLRLKTCSIDRTEYILKPVTGEHLSDESAAVIANHRRAFGDESNTQLVISDGLNALAVTDGDQLLKLVTKLRSELAGTEFILSPMNLVIDSGRVRAGNRIGEQLFGNRVGSFTILHIIGERPGTGHHTLSVYITTADGQTYGTADAVDHNITKVVSGIAGNGPVTYSRWR